jgi:hypothetical protein
MWDWPRLRYWKVVDLKADHHGGNQVDKDTNHKDSDTKKFPLTVSDERTSRKDWGGRRRQNMTFDEEQILLALFLEKAKGGGVLIVTPIQVAYEERTGHKVAESTIYRMPVITGESLHRAHGIRRSTRCCEKNIKKFSEMVNGQELREAMRRPSLRIMFEDELVLAGPTIPDSVELRNPHGPW